MFVPKKFAAPHHSSPSSIFTVRTSAGARERDAPGDAALDGRTVHAAIAAREPMKKPFRVSCISMSFLVMILACAEHTMPMAGSLP
jgi:hypothetical protein